MHGWKLHLASKRVCLLSVLSVLFATSMMLTPECVRCTVLYFRNTIDTLKTIRYAEYSLMNLHRVNIEKER